MKATILTAGLLACAVLGCAHNDKHDKMAKGHHEDNDETMVQFADVPATAQATLTKENGGTTPDDVEKEMHHGKAVYEIHTSMNNKDYEVKVAPDGTLVSRELEVEHDRPHGGKKDQ